MLLLRPRCNERKKLNILFSDQTHLFIAKNNAPIIEKCCLKCETAQAVVILQVNMIPLNHQGCTCRAQRDREEEENVAVNYKPGFNKI